VPETLLSELSIFLFFLLTAPRRRKRTPSPFSLSFFQTLTSAFLPLTFYLDPRSFNNVLVLWYSLRKTAEFTIPGYLLHRAPLPDRGVLLPPPSLFFFFFALISVSYRGLFPGHVWKNFLVSKPLKNLFFTCCFLCFLLLFLLPLLFAIDLIRPSFSHVGRNRRFCRELHFGLGLKTYVLTPVTLALNVVNFISSSFLPDRDGTPYFFPSSVFPFPRVNSSDLVRFAT